MSEAGVSLHFDARQLPQISEAMTQLALAAANRRPILAAIGERLVTSTKERFERQHDPEGRPWKPLAWLTLLKRAGGSRAWDKRQSTRGAGVLTKRAEARIAGAQILINRGLLLGSITARIAGEGVEVGSNKVYARIHQLGGAAGRGHKVKIPARPYLGITDADKSEIGHIIHRHLSLRGAIGL